MYVCACKPGGTNSLVIKEQTVYQGNKGRKNLFWTERKHQVCVCVTGGCSCFAVFLGFIVYVS